MDELDNTARARYQRMGEQLLGDSSLRDALNDEQAHRLLAWGLEQVKREARHSAHLAEADAEPLLQQRVNNVRRAMRHINRLVQSLGAGDEGNVREEMTQLVDALHEIDAMALHIEDIFSLEHLKQDQETLDQSAIFERLMAIAQQVGGAT